VLAGFVGLAQETVTMLDSNIVIADFLATASETFVVADSAYARGWLQINNSESADWTPVLNNQSVSWLQINDSETADWTPVLNNQ
jgi:hypothetical protein